MTQKQVKQQLIELLVKNFLKQKKEKQEDEGTFPTFTYEELAASAPIVYKDYEDAARDQYNREAPLD